MKRSLTIPLLLTISTLPAVAATRIWDGDDATANLLAPANWNPNATPVAGDTLVFPAGVALAKKTVYNNFPVNTTFAGLTFNDGSYTLGGTLLRMTARIAGDFPAGKLMVNAGFTMVGSTGIDARNGAHLHFGAASQFYFEPAAEPFFDADASSIITVDGVLAGAAKLYLGDGTFNFNGAKTTTAEIRAIGAPSIVINHGQSLGPANGGDVNIHGSLKLASPSPQTFPKRIIINSSGAASTALISEGAAHIMSGAVTLNASSALSIDVPDGSLNLSGPLSGSGGPLIKKGPGTLQMSGGETNTFGNIFRIEDGTLELAKTGAGRPAISGTHFQIGNSSGAPNSAQAIWKNSGQLAADTQMTVFSDGRMDLNGWVETVGNLTVQAPGSVDTGVGTLFHEGNLTVNGAPGAAGASMKGAFRYKPGNYTWTINDFSDGPELDCSGGLQRMDAGDTVVTINGAGSIKLFGFHSIDRLIYDGTGELTGGGLSGGMDLDFRGGKLSASMGVRHFVAVDGLVDLGPGLVSTNFSCKTCILESGVQMRYSRDTAADHKHDVIYASEAVTLNNPSLVVISPPNSFPSPGDEFHIIVNTGNQPVTGQFLNLPEGSMYGPGSLISYKGGDGNDVTLTWIVPPTGTTRTWDGGGGDNNWTTAGNWAGNVAPQPGDALVFPVNALRRTNTNNFAAGTVFQSITVVSGSYIISGNRIMLNEGLHFTNPSGTPVWSAPLVFALPGSITATGSGALVDGWVDFANNPTTLSKDAGSGELIFAGSFIGTLDCAMRKRGAGSVRLAATNNFNGSVYVEEGRLIASKDECLSPLHGEVYISENAELRLDGGGLPLNVKDTFFLSGTFSVSPEAACVVRGAIIPAGPAAVIRTENSMHLQGQLDGPGTVRKTGTAGLAILDDALQQVAGGLFIDEGTVNLEMTTADTVLTSPIVIGGVGLPAKLLLATSHQLGDAVAIQIHPSGTFDAAAFTDTFGTLTMTGGSVIGTSASPLMVKTGVITTHAAASSAIITARLGIPDGVAGQLVVADGAAVTDLSLQSRIYGGTFEKTGPGRVDFMVNQPPDAFDVLDIRQGSALFFANSQFTNILLNGGTLGGHGTVGEIKSLAGGTLSPGASPGVLGGYKSTWNAATAVSMELNGLNPGAEYDQYSANGTLDLGNAKLKLSTGFDPLPGAEFMIIRNVSGEPVTGTFSGIPQNGYVSAPGAKVFRINYTGGDGDDVTLTRVSVDAPVIVSHSMSPGTGDHIGEYESSLTAKGTPGLTYDLEVSTDLQVWNTVASRQTSLETGLVSFVFFSPDNNPRLFLRVRLP